MTVRAFFPKFYSLWDYSFISDLYSLCNYFPDIYGDPSYTHSDDPETFSDTDMYARVESGTMRTTIGRNHCRNSWRAVQSVVA